MHVAMGCCLRARISPILILPTYRTPFSMQHAYVEGVSAGKEELLQAGFNAGYEAGSRLGVALGQLRGVVRCVSSVGSGSRLRYRSL